MTDPQDVRASAPARPGSGDDGPTPEPRPASAAPVVPPTERQVEYKGAPLDAAKGPGLGCFWIQLVALAALVVVTPLSVIWDWPEVASAGLLVLTLLLLLFAGQTVIFLLRLVAADRRAAARRAPLASRTPTVGQIEDEVQGSSVGSSVVPPGGSPPAGDTPATSPPGDADSSVPE